MNRVKDVIAVEVNPYADEVINTLADDDSSRNYSVIQLGRGDSAFLIRSVQEWALLSIKANELQVAFDQSDSTGLVEDSGRLWSQDELLERLGIANDLRDNARIRLVAEYQVSVLQTSSKGVTQRVRSRRLIDVSLEPVELQITPQYGYVFTGSAACHQDQPDSSPSHTHDIYTVSIDWWGRPTSLVVTTGD